MPALSITGAQADDATPSVYVPIAGVALVDTTTGAGGSSLGYSAGETRSYTVAGVGTIPTSGVVAVNVNLAITSSTGSNGYATLYASGTPRPDTTNMKFAPGTLPDSNTAIVPVGSDGKISIFVGGSASGLSQVAVSINGYVTTDPNATGTGYTPVTPVRAYDSRASGSTSIPTNGYVDVQLTGAMGWTSSSTAAFVNVQAVTPTAAGYFQVATPQDSTGSSGPTVRFSAGGTDSAGVIARLNPNGKLRVYNRTSVPVGAIVDLQGFFTSDLAGAPLTAYSAKLYDSRDNGSTKIAPNATVSIPVAGQAGLPVVELGIAALNFTAVNSKAQGDLTAWASGSASPSTPLLSFSDDGTFSNLAFVPIGDDGAVSVRNNSASPLILTIDIEGWTPTVEPGAPAMTSYGVDTSELADLRKIAADRGITLQAAVNNYGWQDNLGQAVARIQDDYPDTFASAEATGNSSGVLRFKGSPPNVSSYLTGVAASISVTGNEQYSSQQIAQYNFAAADAAAQQYGASSVSVVASYDRVANVITAKVSGATDAEWASGNLTTGPPPEGPPIQVERSSEVPQTDTFRGGVKIGTAGGTYCTSGFPARVTGTLAFGIITADHCPDDTNYYSYRTSTQRYALYSATYRVARIYGDVEFHQRRINEAVGISFYYGVGTYRAITGIASPIVGQSLCMFGRTTNAQRCGTVVSQNNSIHYADVNRTYGSIATIFSDLSQPGDSGGPVYRGGVAVGMISGSSTMSTYISPLSGLSRASLEINR